MRLAVQHQCEFSKSVLKTACAGMCAFVISGDSKALENTAICLVSRRKKKKKKKRIWERQLIIWQSHDIQKHNENDWSIESSWWGQALQIFSLGLRETLLDTHFLPKHSRWNCQISSSFESLGDVDETACFLKIGDPFLPRVQMPALRAQTEWMLEQYGTTVLPSSGPEIKAVDKIIQVEEYFCITSITKRTQDLRRNLPANARPRTDKTGWA